MDIDFAQTFSAATLSTLQVQCNYKATAGKPFRKGTGEEVRTAIAGVIDMNSTTFIGRIAICFPETTFLKIMEGMIGEPCTAITQDIQDGAAELMNIVFGDAKKSMAEKGLTVHRAIPSVIQNKEVKLGFLTEEEVLVIPFSSPTGNLQIEFVVEESL